MITEKSVGAAAKVMLACSLIGTSLFTYIPAAQAVEESEQVNVSQVLSTLKVGSKNLDVSSGALMYKETVDHDVEEIEILTASDNSDAIITINGTKITNGKSEAFLLKTGVNTFRITVSDGEDPQTIYTVEVEREKSDNALLKNLNLSKGFLSFDNKVTSYKTTVANEVDALTVTPEVQDESASVTVNGTAVTDKGVSVNLPVGATTIKIVVTAENGEMKNYTLVVTRTGKEKVASDSEQTTDQKKPSVDQAHPVTAPEQSSGSAKNMSNQATMSKQQPVKTVDKSTEPSFEANGELNTESSFQTNSAPKLTSLTVSKGTWNKSFDSDEYTYHLEVDKDVESVKINAAASVDGATIEYEGESSATVKIKDKAKTAVSVSVTKDNNRRTYVLIFEKDIDVEMDEEETVDDVAAETEQAEETNALEATSSDLASINNLRSNSRQMDETQSTESPSFLGRIQSFFRSIFQ
ncbi:cadherin-like beta sandwich domain-containing protein [Peribacillus asahii]|uniref:cadherin-like beta sandwich domain-containing protein n=1 Tax=Peribacillus asahii TaxID=228899 RepID=UPI0038026331